MAYRLKILTDVQAKPSREAERFGRFGNGTVLFGTGNKFKDATSGEAWVNVLIPPGIRDGWILEANCDEIPDPEPPPLDRESFVRQCILVERIFNNSNIAPWYISADFLIARAIIETKITSVMASPGPDGGVGPLRVSPNEWKDYLNNGGQESGFGEKDHFYPMVQVRGAGYRMHRDVKAISEAKPKDASAVISNDPFLPSYLDVFHAYLADAKAALSLREAEKDQSKTVGEVLSTAQITAVSAREQFKGIGATTKVVDFVAKTETVLREALQTAFDEIKRLAPDELPQTNPGRATWFDIAAAEMKDGVSEKTHPDRIKSYFAATDFGKVGAGDPIPHWCGAFAAHCMKASGNAANIPKGAARAANWKTFGQSVPVGSRDVPVGAVVVLTPSEKTGTSGHIGFFVSMAGNKITLRGGNQSDAVNETPFPASQIAAIRWLETAPTSMGEGAGKFNFGAAGVPEARWKFGDLIADRFGRAGFGPTHRLAAVANAIGESGLDPEAKSPPPEKSFGLFQCNQTAGLGIGFTVEQLCDPEVNIGIVLKEAKKFSEFTGASTVEAAIDAFVRFVERPKDTAGAIAKRISIAKKL